MDKKYLRVYKHYIDLIREGSLKKGDKMPSLRSAVDELQVSRTTVETAYFYLAADGYITSKERSGYFVTGLGGDEKGLSEKNVDVEQGVSNHAINDNKLFVVTGDKEGFCFDLWRRYMKSSLRQDDRLLSYSQPQGEYDLRVELAKYVKATRNIICGPEDIIIGSGVQSLLRILVPLINKAFNLDESNRTVSLPTKSFKEAEVVFSDYSYNISYRNKESRLIYVAPAHMTKYGEVMTVKRRMELIEHGRNSGRFIIEDDYENELVFTRKPTPSLYALAGGRGIAYLGSFSKMLLPSIRISFMVIPKELREVYAAVCDNIVQTASKAEQIALSQFLRDGHLSTQIRKIKRLYGKKRELFLESVKRHFDKDCQIKIGDSGTEILLNFPDKREILISCSGLAIEEFDEELEKLKNEVVI